MSLGYAEKLSYRDDLGGKLGAPEYFDPPEEVDRKVTRLAQLVKDSKNIIAFTGAGISTSCGIPDFRGPSGIWTLQKAGQPLPKAKVSFAVAKPSFTHASLVSLMNSGKLTYIVSQNVDGLHLRSGVPRHKLAELHGNCFSERCCVCGREYIRDFEMETVGFKSTGRLCTEPGCKGNLHDHVLDWEDALPEDELQASEVHAREADLAICMGTSLQITPACNLPLKTIKKYKNKEIPGKLVIINLQRTQHDKRAESSGGLVIRAKTDEVMRLLISKLALSVPKYLRSDSVIIQHAFKPCKPDGKGSVGTLQVCIRSIHGRECLIPVVTAVSYEFGEQGEGIVIAEQPPFTAYKTVCRHGVHPVRVTLHLQPEADQEKVTTSYDAVVEESDGLVKNSDVAARAFSFTSQNVDWDVCIPSGREEKEIQCRDRTDLAVKKQRLV